MAVREYVPKDLKSYKAKVFKHLTAPQLFASIASILILFFTLKYIPKDWAREVRILIAAVPAAIPFLFTFEVYGKTIPKAIPEIFRDYFLDPQKRYYGEVQKPPVKAVKLDRENKPLSVARPVKAKKSTDRIILAQTVKPAVPKVKPVKPVKVKPAKPEKVKPEKIKKENKKVTKKVEKPVKEITKNEITKQTDKKQKTVKTKHTGLYSR